MTQDERDRLLLGHIANGSNTYADLAASTGLSHNYLITNVRDLLVRGLIEKSRALPVVPIRWEITQAGRDFLTAKRTNPILEVLDTPKTLPEILSRIGGARSTRQGQVSRLLAAGKVEVVEHRVVGQAKMPVYGRREGSS